MTTWLIVNSISIAVMGAVLYLTLRQLGYVLNRVGPVGARGTTDGPRLGENLSHYLPELRHAESAVKAKLIVFGSDSCSVCSAIRKGAEVLSREWRKDADIFLIYDCTSETDEGPITVLSPGLFMKRDCSLRRSLGASFVPFGIVTDGNGTVVGKGLVNEIAHLESLLELERSKAREFPSLIGSAPASA